MKIEDLLSLKQFKVWLRTDIAISVLSTFVIGLLVHMYIYTNSYLGHDTTSFYMPDKSWFIRTGRYVYAYIKNPIHNSLLMPFYLGLIALTLLGLSSALICKTLKIDKPLLVVLVSALIITWPTYTAMHVVIFSFASGSAVGIFFACLSAYIADKYRLGFIAGMLFLVISMGCYQAFWSICAALLLLCLIRHIFNSELTTKYLLLKSFKFGIMLVLAILLYYLLWMLVLKRTGYSIANYVGMSDMGYKSIIDLVSILKYAYSSLFGFYFKIKSASYYPPYLTFVGVVSIFFSLFIIAKLYIKQKIYKQRIRTLLLFLCLILLPIAMNTTIVFSKGAAQSILTRFTFAFIFLLLPMLLPLIDIKKKIYSIAFFVSVIAIGLSSLNGFYGANVTYLRFVTDYHIAISTATQWLSRIQSEEDYKVDTPIAIIGKPYAPPITYGYGWAKDIATNTALTYRLPIRGILWTFSPRINIVDDTKYRDLEGVKSLNVFPSHNCIIWIDGVLVLKLS